MSLSLRLFGNIAGEYMTVALVLLVVPFGIPLILHALGLIPAFVQALVFTLLTTSFLANAVHHEERKAKDAKPRLPRRLRTQPTFGGRSHVMNEVWLALIAVLPIAIGAAFASLAMRYVSTSAIDGMTRQPEIAPQLFTAMLIGMALIEALCIYTLVVTLVISQKI